MHNPLSTSNDAVSKLSLPISPTDTVIVVEQGDKFNIGSNGSILKITEFDSNGILIKRENVFCSSRDGNNFVVQRAYESLPIDDTTNSRTQEALSFTANAIVESVISETYLQQINENITELDTNKQDTTTAITSVGDTSLSLIRIPKIVFTTQANYDTLRNAGQLSNDIAYFIEEA